MNKDRTYTELSKFKTFDERFRYLKLVGTVGAETFGSNRFLNQAFYSSGEWKAVKRDVIIRDLGCDLGLEGFEIFDRLFVHHMNPITDEDIINHNPDILNPEYLICCGLNTHNAIHFGNANLLTKEFTERSRYDTCPWKAVNK